MPSFPIIDSHVHIYDPAYLTYHWMKNVPRLNKPYLMTDFTRLTAGVEVDKIVFVEVDVAVGQHLDEARWVALQAQTDNRLRGMVASMPLEKGLAVERARRVCRDGNRPRRSQAHREPSGTRMVLKGNIC